MKRVLFFLMVFCSVSSLSAKNDGHELSEWLQKCIAQVDVHPDSIFPHLRYLEKERQSSPSPQKRVMYATVLGKLYALNAWRSQSSYQHTQAPLDSLQEWSREDYIVASRRCFADALSQKDLLFSMPTHEWIPMVERGRDEAIFGRNMLNVVWRAYLGSGIHLESQDAQRLTSIPALPTYADMIGYYKQKGLRKAAFFLELDSVDAGDWNKREASLKRIAEDYADLAESAKALHLLILQTTLRQDWNSEKGRQERFDQLAEVLKSHPGYKDKGGLRNEMLRMQEPTFAFKMKERTYTGRDILLPYEHRNVSLVRCTLYRLPDHLDTDKYSGEELRLWLQKNGQAVKRLTLKPEPGQSPFLLKYDTLRLSIEEHGRYAFLAEPQTKVKLDSKQKPGWELTTFSATRLLPVTTQLYDQKRTMRITVLDALTGSPQEGVEVKVAWEPARGGLQDTVYVSLHTDKRGIVDIQTQKYAQERRASVTFQKGEDKYFPRMSLSVARSYEQGVQQASTPRYSVFTDRSIYRPGQTLEVSGIAFEQNGWDAWTKEDKEVNLRIYDPDYNKMKDTVLLTDELGCVAASIPLSPHAKQGAYTVEIEHVRRTVMVEAYKRPTFEVTMEEPVLASKTSAAQGELRTGADSSLASKADSIVFKGRALTYAGVPVRKARVTGQYRWNEGWLKRYVTRLGRPLQTDTVWTDEEGRFTMTLPNTLTQEERRVGRWLNLRVDVLSSQGETHSAEATASVCSTPLRMTAEAQDLQDKDRLQPWHLNLIDALGREVEGEVKLTFTPAGKGHQGASPYVATLQANKPETVSSLKDMPSGAYTCIAEAVVKGDTARLKQRVVLFSMQDNVLPTDTVEWFYMPSDTFTVGRPAHIQVGSALEDVTLYYIINGQDQIYEDSMVCLSHELKTITIPYCNSMHRGASVTIFFVKNEKLHQRVFELRPLMPDYRLKTHWTTFRDRVRPGQQEHWSLQILQPDGMPAKANLMATLYDASLDALRPHTFHFDVVRSYSSQSIYPRSTSSVEYIHGVYFPLKMEKEYAWTFSQLAEDLFYNPDPRRRGMILRDVSVAPRARMMKAANGPGFGGAGMAIQESEISFSTKGISAKDFEELGITSVDEALQGRIAGLDIVESSAQQGTGANRLRGSASYEEEDILEEDTPTDWSTLRTNFSETAFFLPQLRTDEGGNVSLDFTLPESLTRWHLLGFAHTQDMLTAGLDESIVAQKELMAQLFLPRFLRVGDKAMLTASIQNISEDTQEKGVATFEILDARTEKMVLRKKVGFSLAALQDTVYYFPFDVKDAEMDLLCRWVAQGNSCSDGEQRLVPVLSDTETLTRTKAITLLDKGTTTYDLQHLFPKDATKRKLTVEYTTHPVWSAIQALPTLFHTCHDDLLTLTSGYYAATLCKHLCETVEDMDKVVKVDMDSVEDFRTKVWEKILERQLGSGAFIWFPGMESSTYLTREVAFQLVRLNRLLGEEDERTAEVLEKAVTYLRSQLKKDTSLSTSALHHLYIVSSMGKDLDTNEKRLLKELAKVSDEWSLEDRALASIVLHIQDKNRATNRMMDGVEKYLVGTPETGRYVDYPSGSFTSIDRKIHIHTQIMEAVMAVRPEAQELWKGMRRWLLLEKRTTDWNTPINTIDAVYALLSAGREELKDEAQDALDVKGKGYTQRLTSPDHRKGYVKAEIDVPSPKTLQIHKVSQGESWGAVYAQFDQQMDSVSAAWQGINIRREMSHLSPKVGDRIHIRYVITATMDYDYVLLHAPRPASTEPAQPMSGHLYSNGLSCYRTVRDEATDYYVAHLPKGTYVLEEDVMVEREGSYNAGITTIECMYAPEYRAYTGNVKMTPKR